MRENIIELPAPAPRLTLDQLRATPPVQHTLAQLVGGALNIANLSVKRLPTPQELLLLQQWLEEAQRMILTNRKYQ